MNKFIYRYKYGIVFLIFYLFFPGQRVWADNPPVGQEPGAQVERIQEESQKRKQQLEKTVIKTPPIQQEKEQEAVAKTGLAFVLQEVDITGMTLFKPQDFLFVYKPYLNQTVTTKEINAVIDKIKGAYKKKSYFTTIVRLPEQNIQNGKLEIRVFEGKMGDLKIEGNKSVSGRLLARYFHVKKNELLDFQTMQRDLLRLEGNSILSVRAVISAGALPQTSDITLKIEEKRPDHLGISFDNQGTRLTGKYRESVWWGNANVTGRLDSLYMYTIFTTLSLGKMISYETPLGTYGTKFGMSMVDFDMKSGKEFKSFDITGHSQIFDPHFSWELALREDFQASAQSGIEIKSIKKKILGTTTADDQLRLPYVGFHFVKIDSWRGSTEFSPRFTFGTSNFLGASSENHPSAGRAKTGGGFFKYEQGLNRMQKMPVGALSIRSHFQFASHTLTSSEQLQLGGANSIRGYPEGDYLADGGGFVNLDWYFPAYFIPQDWKILKSGKTLRSQIEPVIFFDAGGGQLKKVLPGEKHTKTLMGVGGGIGWHLSDDIYLRLDWAKHIGEKPTQGTGHSTFNLTFQWKLW
ncbi:MAG: ShlB/FhaC/HecB family hemolysin secretion/activation protein [Candidatus Omnitrophica bacterium]|nr:ShlB/FhaC/HecB family hemolysin secretion/activation protein [Candidatus Omnitrophota bacterium]